MRIEVHGVASERVDAVPYWNVSGEPMPSGKLRLPRLLRDWRGSGYANGWLGVEGGVWGFGMG